MKIRKLDTGNKKDRNQFIEFPHQLYRDCPYWVPPLQSEMTLVLNKNKHPFYQHSEADFFIAESENDTLGRLAVIHNRNFCQHQNSKTAFFFYFDAVDDSSVSNALFEAAAVWAIQRGLETITGPKGFLRSSGMGLLVEGFDYLPAIGIPYNYEYYEKLAVNYGFEKKLDHLSGYMNTDSHLPERLYEVAEKVKKRGNFWVMSFTNTNQIKKMIPQIKQVQDEAFLDNPNYFPSTDAEFDLIANNLTMIADPRLIKLIMKGDDVAGFVLSYADISTSLQRSGGKLFPFGWYHILKEKQNSKVVNINGLGLLPQYQGLGGNALLYTELEKTLRQFPFERAEFVQVNEDNFKSKSDWETLGVIFHKNHRSYKISIG